MKRLTLLIAALALVSPATAQVRTAANTVPKPAAAAAPNQSPIPDANTQLIMIRSTLLALSHANVTNNYTVLSSLASANFRGANPPAKLAQSFVKFRENRIDLAPLSLVGPRQTAAPTIAGGRLRLVGQFPTQPMQVDYDLTFEPEQGQWRLFAISVNLQGPTGR
jgi:hypothetical protein